VPLATGGNKLSKPKELFTSLACSFCYCGEAADIVVQWVIAVLVALCVCCCLLFVVVELLLLLCWLILFDFV